MHPRGFAAIAGLGVALTGVPVGMVPPASAASARAAERARDHQETAADERADP